MAKKNSIITVDISEDGNSIYVAAKGVSENVTLPIPDLSDDIRHAALAHGLKQKISDAAALPKGATPEDKFAAMSAVVAQLMAGDWNKSRGDGSAPVAGIIYRAFRQWVEEVAKSKKATAPSDEATRAVYEGKTRSEQLALRNVPRIAEIMDEMRAASGKSAEVSTDNLLGELGL